jgi:hypothetical protein
LTSSHDLLPGRRRKGLFIFIHIKFMNSYSMMLHIHKHVQHCTWSIVCMCLSSYACVSHHMYVSLIICMCLSSYACVSHHMYVSLIICMCLSSYVCVSHHMHVSLIICMCLYTRHAAVIATNRMCSIYMCSLHKYVQHCTWSIMCMCNPQVCGGGVGMWRRRRRRRRRYIFNDASY